MSMLQDLRYAARGLARRPALAVVTTLALTIGIAANAIMFGVVDQLLLSPPRGVTAAGDVKRIYFEQTYEGKKNVGPITNYPYLAAIRDNVPAFQGMSVVFTGSYDLGRGADARQINVQLVSANYFDLLGVRPQRGRTFAPDEDRPPRGANVAIVSDGFWKVQLGESADVVGRQILVDGKSFMIIGVAPRGFSGIDRGRIDMWVPVSALADNFGKDWYNAPNWYWASGIARLRTDVSQAVAEQQTTATYRNAFARWSPGMRDSTTRALLGPLVAGHSPAGVSPEGKVSLWLMGVSVIVLLIACANVANLLIARTLQRRREIAVRLALGVSRGRLLRQLLTEAALLALLAGVAAVFVAHWGSRVVQHTLLPGTQWNEDAFDPRVLGFMLLAAIACILFAGLTPAIYGMRTSVSEGLKSSSRQVAGGAGRSRLVLLVVQAALSLVLLVGAGLFVKSLRNILARDVGIDLDRVASVTMDLSKSGFTKAQISETWQNALERVRRVQGVRSASLAAATVPMQTASAMRFHVPGVERPDIPNGGPYEAAVGADYFATLGARMVRGRALTANDERAGSRVVVVNELLAKAYWPHKNPIGQCAVIHTDETCSEVVGVVQDIMLFGMIRDERALVYAPLSHPAYKDFAPAAMLVRTSGDPAQRVELLRKEIQALGPSMPFVSIRPFREIVAPQLNSWRLGANMFSLFGVIALVIAAVGLYSVMAYWVSQRTQEIGVRMALGAQRRDVVALVTRQSSAAMLLGVVIGALVAVLASRWIADLLYETSPRDPVVYAGAALVLIAAGLVASVIPARRSTRVDPVIALRSD